MKLLFFLSVPSVAKRLLSLNWLIPVLFSFLLFSCSDDVADPFRTKKFDAVTTLWYRHPAGKWQEALPVGNGRLGAMVFGKTDEERIQINEETYWSGGPYKQTVKGGYRALPEIQKLIFSGQYLKAHKLFGRNLMGYPVEQMKYQSFANLILKFSANGEVKNYRHQLDLRQAIVTTSYEQNGVHYRREVFISPVDQVLIVRLTADKPGCISFVANLRGCRNQAHSNYATDYFRMDGDGKDGLILRGKSADYLGVTGRIRYEGKLKAVPEGGEMTVADTDLIIRKADAVTLYIAAATNFVNYKDVSADPGKRNRSTFSALAKKPYGKIKADHIMEHRRLFDRVAMDLGSTKNSYLPTDERLNRFDGANDPGLAALYFHFARYLLISSSRPGTQPANLQGIWNDSMNPRWDSKYTTNINTEMNYWIAEAGNLSECTEPLFRMITELTDRGRDVAREHYGARGWVFHQNTDLWRVAAPMDGPDWGAFTTGGAWLCTHLWEHFLYTGDLNFLRHIYPVMKGNVQFFLDFLVEHPKFGWLVTNPATSPENFPGRPGNHPFYDEVCGWLSPGTTICAGSTIDMQILKDLFGYVARAADTLKVDREFRGQVLAARDRLAPMQIGEKGNLQEWLEDWDQKEKSHRHISNLYGLFPGNQISVRRTPKLAEACEVVLQQRGLTGNGWSSAWKTACWARLYNSGKAMENMIYYTHHYCLPNLFSICSGSLQVDGSFGIAAAVVEMLLQSHENELFLLPALPSSWQQGSVNGLRGRGGFTLNMKWQQGKLISARIISRLGKNCKIRIRQPVEVFSRGMKVAVKKTEGNLIEFKTEKNQTYLIVTI